MGSSVVVAVQERLEVFGAFGVAGPGLSVGPFAGEGAVVALDLAVGLGAVGPGPFVSGLRQRQRGRERERAVAGAVIGEHSADAADAVAAEELHRPRPKRRGGGALLVEQLFGVGQPRMVIERGVQVDVAGPGAGVLGPLGSLMLR